MIKLKLIAVLAVAVVIAVLVPAAHADTVTPLNYSASNGTGPFGTVTLHIVSATQVQVTVALAPNVFAVTGAGDAQFGFTVDKSYTLVASTLTTGYTLLAPGSYSFSALGAAFTSGVDCSICGSGTSAPNSSGFTMTLTNAGGLTPADFVGNGTYLFAADVGVPCVGQAGCPSSGFNTFVVGATPPVTTPEPSTSMLLGFGLLGLVGLRRKQIFG
jgi:hypothetical protein